MAKKKKQPMSRKKRAVLLLIAAVPVLAALMVVAWHWQQDLRVEQVVFGGFEHAQVEALESLAAVDTGAVLFDLDPVLLADRVRRHPWVAAAQVTRLWTGTLAVEVTERVPVALVLDEAGRPSHYLDAAGQQMPWVAGAAYDVPLVRELSEAYHPVRPVQHAALRQLLPVLPQLRPDVDALISEFEIRGDEIWLWTAPAPGREAFAVRLGTEQFPARFARLHAFWHQAILPQPDQQFRWIDLRFDSQIVTK